jgi:hypothetical protein
MVRKAKSYKMLAAVSLATVAVPAYGLGLGDLAAVVLKGSSVLKKGEQKCGSTLALSSTENLILTEARSAVFKSIPAATFTKLDSDAEASADTSAQSKTFCPETKKKKKGLLSGIKKAGKSILAGGKLLGI